MPPRSQIATVLCLTAILSSACACGVPKQEDGALENRGFAAGTRARLAQGTRLRSGGQPEEVDRHKRAAAFRDYGRYYK